MWPAERVRFQTGRSLLIPRSPFRPCPRSQLPSFMEVISEIITNVEYVGTGVALSLCVRQQLCASACVCL